MIERIGNISVEDFLCSKDLLYVHTESEDKFKSLCKIFDDYIKDHLDDKRIQNKTFIQEYNKFFNMPINNFDNICLSNFGNYSMIKIVKANNYNLLKVEL